MPNRGKPVKKMSKKSSHRAWSIIRLALLWARKGSMFKNRLVFTMQELRQGFKKVHYPEDRRPLAYGDREFSFGESPMIHIKIRRPSSLRFKVPNIPCINSQVDFDYDFDFGEEIIVHKNDQTVYSRNTSNYLKGREEEEEEEINDTGDIDVRAEEFIAKFYKEMELQKQRSL